MNRLHLFILGLLGAMAAAGPVSAQPGSAGSGYIPPRSPTYSPYLNLNRPGGSITQNYFGLVRPELDFRNQIQGIDQQIYNTQQNVTSLQSGNAPLPATGHAVRFMDLGGYYQNRSGGSSGARNLGGGQVGQAPAIPR